MSSFTSPLVVSPINSRDWKLMRRFTYHVGSKYSRTYIRVPRGFVTDFASVPRIFWSLIPPWGRYGKAAVIHDYLYKENIGSRKSADDIFLEAMEVLKVSVLKRIIMYWAVRIFGYFAWHH
jgi:hypothetical protein